MDSLNEELIVIVLQGHVSSPINTGATMVVRFDVFRIEADERLHRLGTAKSLDEAKKFVTVLAIGSTRREFCVIDQMTGEKVVLKIERQGT